MHFGIEAFLKRTPEIQKMIFKIHKLDFTKQKSFCIAKETVRRAKHSWQSGRRSLPTPDRGLASETQWATKVKSTKPGVLGYAFSPSSWGAESRQILGTLRLDWLIYIREFQVSHSETLSQNKHTHPETHTHHTINKWVKGTDGSQKKKYRGHHWIHVYTNNVKWTQ